MADLDTRSKRASSIAILSATTLAPPAPDATLDQGDRQHIAFSYSGILAGGVVVTAGGLLGPVIDLPEASALPPASITLGLG